MERGQERDQREAGSIPFVGGYRGDSRVGVFGGLGVRAEGTAPLGAARRHRVGACRGGRRGFATRLPLPDVERTRPRRAAARCEQ